MNASHSDPDAAVDAAIARVLAAEREASAAVEQSARDADALLESARAAARALAQRTERRIGVLRAAFERLTADEVARLHTEASRLEAPPALGADDRERVFAAVARLAQELVGAD